MKPMTRANQPRLDDKKTLTVADVSGELLDDWRYAPGGAARPLRHR